MAYARRDKSILIAEDHAATRRFLASLLEDTVMQVIGEAANGHEAVTLCEQWRPDIIVLDISMPLLDGFGAAQQIAELSPTTKIIFVTGHTSEEYVREALRIGAAGFVSKKLAVHDLPAAIEAAIQGKTYVSLAVGQHKSARSYALARFEVSSGVELEPCRV